MEAGEGVTDEAIADVKNAITLWNQENLDKTDCNAANGANARVPNAPCLDLITSGGIADVVIKMKVDNGPILGLTSLETISPSSCELKSVSIQIRGEALGLNFSNVQIINVFLHELGHAFGLGHTDNQNDPMYLSADILDTCYPVKDPNCIITPFTEVDDIAMNAIYNTGSCIL